MKASSLCSFMITMYLFNSLVDALLLFMYATGKGMGREATNTHGNPLESSSTHLAVQLNEESTSGSGNAQLEVLL